MKINPAYNLHTVNKEIRLSKKIKADKNFKVWSCLMCYNVYDFNNN